MDEIKFVRKSKEKKDILGGLLYSNDTRRYEFLSPYGPVFYETKDYSICLIDFHKEKEILPSSLESLIPPGYEFVRKGKNSEKALAKAYEKAAREDPKTSKAKFDYILEWRKRTNKIKLEILEFIQKELNKEIEEEVIKLNKDKSIW